MTDTNESVDPATKKPAIDRVTLEKAEAEKVHAWLRQLQDNSRGFLQLTKSDIVNFLIRQHFVEFTKKEMHQIRQDHYDPVKHLLWITPKLKAAISSGDGELVSALQEEIRGIELCVVSDAKEKVGADSAQEFRAPRQRKSKKLSMKDEAHSVRPEGNFPPES